MKAYLFVAAAALVAGCAAGSTSSNPLARGSAGRAPDGMLSFTVRYPAGLVRAGANSSRTPRFVDPYNSPWLLMSTHEYGSNANATACAPVAPGPDGTQQVVIPVFSGGGTLTIQEYQTGNAACNVSGEILAQTWTPGYNGGYGNNVIGYTGFTPGTNVYAVTPTPGPSPSPTPSGAPPAPYAGPLFAGPLTLQPVVRQMIYAVDGGPYNSLLAGVTMLNTSSTPAVTCGNDSLTFLAADANGVSIGASSVPSPAPSSSASPVPTPAPYSGFLPVTFSPFTATGSLSASVAAGGSVNVNHTAGMGTLHFTVTANDVFGASITKTISVNC